MLLLLLDRPNVAIHSVENINTFSHISDKERNFNIDQIRIELENMFFLFIESMKTQLHR